MTEREKRLRQQREYYKANRDRFLVAAAKRYKEKHPYPRTARTHCKNGHELVDSNLYQCVLTNGKISKRCKICAKKQSGREPLKNRARHLKNRFGMTPQQYDEMLNKQEGRCAVCGTEKPTRHGNCFYIDHDHKTGKIRKLLCMHCNSALGYVDDDINILKKLIKYLEDFNAAWNDGGKK